MTRKQVWVVGLLALFGGVVGGALACLIVSGPQALAQAGAAQQIVSAQAFHLVDADGNVRGRLDFNAQGAPNLSLLDKDGQATIGVTPDGQPCLLLGRGDSGTAMLTAVQGGIYLGITGQGGGGLTLTAGDGHVGLILMSGGKSRAVLSLAPDGSASLTLADKDGKQRAVLGSTELTIPSGSTEVRPESSLVLFDKDGTVIWQAP